MLKLAAATNNPSTKIQQLLNTMKLGSRARPVHGYTISDGAHYECIYNMGDCPARHDMLGLRQRDQNASIESEFERLGSRILQGILDPGTCLVGSTRGAKLEELKPSQLNMFLQPCRSG